MMGIRLGDAVMREGPVPQLGATFARIAAALIAALCASAALVSCGGAEPEIPQREVSEGEAAVTFPAVYFDENASHEDIVAFLESQGYWDVEANRDGSYTVTMDEEVRDSLVDDLHDRTKLQFDSIPNSQDYPNITEIDYSDTFAQVKLVCTTRDLTTDEQSVWQGVGRVAALYQQVAGLDARCDVTFVDAKGAVIKAATYS